MPMDHYTKSELESSARISTNFDYDVPQVTQVLPPRALDV